MQTGKGRHEFLSSVTERLKEKEQQLQENAEQRCCDHHWWQLLFTCEEAAKQHFQKHTVKTATQLEREKTSKERLSLLDELGTLRASVNQSEDEVTEAVNNVFFALQACQRRLRLLKRQIDQRINITLVNELYEALRKHQHSEAHRLARRLAGTGIGIKKRRLGLMPSFVPSKAQLQALAESDAKTGGLSAQLINLEEELDKWTADDNWENLKPDDANASQWAKSDLKGIIFNMIRGPKRKACPNWSLPTEVFLMMIAPGYLSCTEHRGAGLGAPKIEELDTLVYPRKCFLDFLKHMHRVGEAPCYANISRAFFVNRGNGKEELAGLRMIHLYCSWWRHYFGQALRTSERTKKPTWDAWSYAYLPCRRREGAMLVQRAVELRVSQNKLSTMNSFKDMKNAFACTEPEERDTSLDEIVPADEKAGESMHAHSYGHHALFRSRMKNSIVELVGEDGTIHTMPKFGNIIGSSEGPKFFSRSFNRCVKKWWWACRHLTPVISITNPASNKIEDGGLTVFADDICSKRIIIDNEASTAAAAVAMDECSTLDAFLTEGGWVQNIDKMEIVCNLRKEHQNRAFPHTLASHVAQLRENMHRDNIESGENIHDIDRVAIPRCMVHARYLGSRFVWNSNNHPEVVNRDRAMLIAWRELGKFWHEKMVPFKLKRAIFISKVIGAGLSGTLSFCLSKQQYGLLDRRMLGFLRTMLKGACHEVEEDGKHKSWSDNQVLWYWKILPMWHEDAVRRIGWLKAMIMQPGEHSQVVAAVFGNLTVSHGTAELMSSSILDEVGRIKRESVESSFACLFEDSIMMYKDISGTEELFEQWQEWGESWRAILNANELDSQLMHYIEMFDPSIFRAAFFADSHTPSSSFFVPS